MSNEDPNAPTQGAPAPSRRSPRQGVGGSPFGSTLTIVLAVLAVVVGFLILKNITDDGPSSDGGAVTNTTVADSVPDTIVENTSTTLPPLVTTGATVIVANASGVSGAAGRMSAELATATFTMGTPTNSTSAKLEQSVVYYDPNNAAAQPVADSVARVMGGLAVEVVPVPPPIDGGTLGDAGVVVMLGTAQSDKTLAQLAQPVTPTVTAPAVSGGATGGTPGTTTG
jgi:hypothetical protein